MSISCWLESFRNTMKVKVISFVSKNQIFNSFTMFNSIGLNVSSAMLKWFASIKRVENLNFLSHEVNSIMFTTKLNIRLLVDFLLFLL